MLEFYFDNPMTMNRFRSGPSGQFIDSFSGCLKNAGYSWWTARVFLRAADHIGRYAEAQGGDISDLEWSTLTGFRDIPRAAAPNPPAVKQLM